MDERKQQVLQELESSLGIVTEACRKAGISRTTFYQWKLADAEFAEAVAEIQESTIDFVESALLQRIRAGSDAAIIFYLKCRAKSRGYSERPEAGDNNHLEIVMQVSPETMAAVEALTNNN